MSAVYDGMSADRTQYEVRIHGLACDPTGCATKTFRTKLAAVRFAEQSAREHGFDNVYLLRVRSLPFAEPKESR